MTSFTHRSKVSFVLLSDAPCAITTSFWWFNIVLNQWEILIGESGKIITDTGILRDIVFKWHNTSGFVKCADAAILLNIKCQFDIIQTSRNIIFFNIYHGMPWCLSKLQTDWKGVSPFSPCLNVLKFNKFAILMPNMKSAITLMLSQLITT